jgi:hypothetical protein
MNILFVIAKENKRLRQSSFAMTGGGWFIALLPNGSALIQLSQ